MIIRRRDRPKGWGKAWTVLTRLREEGREYSPATLADILARETSTTWSEADVRRLVPIANEAYHVDGIAPLRIRRGHV